MSRLLVCCLFCFFSCGDPSPAAPPTAYDVSQERFREMLGEEEVVLLDVRTPAETAEGMIEGAREIDFKADDFAARIDSLDRDKTYLVYCRSGNRSGKACALMDELGFEHRYNLEGGYLNWEE